jgi:hypothetical protein
LPFWALASNLALSPPNHFINLFSLKLKFSLS